MSEHMVPNESEFYSIREVLASGKPLEMWNLRDHVLLVVNVASNCELTKQNYEELPMLHDQYAKLGLKILAFPCNQFNDGETRATNDILEFVRTFDPKMDDKLIFFQKGLVNGARARPVYKYMTTRARNSDGSMDIRGNFTKFLITHDGDVWDRYVSSIRPSEMKRDIEMLLNQRYHALH